MKISKRRFLYIYVSLVVISLILMLFVVKKINEHSLRLIMCDVGQGDAFLLVNGSFQLLVDAGPDGKVLSCLEHNMPVWDKKLEVMVVTHPDLDHFGGFVHIFKSFSVDMVMIEPLGKDSAAFLEFREALLEEKRQGMKIVIPKKGDFFHYTSRISALVASPEVDTSRICPFWQAKTETILSDNLCEEQLDEEDSNDQSIVLFLLLDQVVVGMMADASTQIESAIIADNLMGEMNILKVGHHGSKTSSSRELLQHFRPEISLISCGKNNKFGHPEAQVLKNLEEFGGEVYRTDQNGEVEVVVTNNNYVVNTQIW